MYVSLANPGGKLVGGLYASGRIVLNEVKGAIAVPVAALHKEDAATYVLVVENGRIARRDVTTGATDEQASLVQVTGLSSGETVVVGPANGLEPGQAITIAGGEG